MGIGIKGRIGNKETEIQVAAHIIKGIGRERIKATKNDHKGFHQKKSGKIEKIKPECAPAVFDGAAQGEKAKKTNCYKKDIAVAENGGKYAGEKTPNLSFQDQSAVKAESQKQNIVICKLAHQIDDGVADDYIEHQIGNADALIAVAEPLEFLP